LTFVVVKLWRMYRRRRAAKSSHAHQSNRRNIPLYVIGYAYSLENFSPSTTMHASMPELYDTLYQADREKMQRYYATDHVQCLGEYAILSLAYHYKYGVLPHYLARGGRDEFAVLDNLRHLRTSFFFGLSDFIDLVNRHVELSDAATVFVNSN
jgi:hypothetical protein